MPKEKRPRGRQPTRVMPELIPASAPDVFRAFSQAPPKQEWGFAEPGGAGYRVREHVPVHPKRADFGPLMEEP